MTQPITDPIIALATARRTARVIRTTHQPEVRERAIELLVQSFDALDNAGIFTDLDELTGYASAEDVLAEAARELTIQDYSEAARLIEGLMPGKRA